MRLDYLKYKAKKKSHFHGADAIDIPIEETLTGHEYARLEAHKEAFSDGNSKKVADLEQNVSHSAAAEVMPCIVTHASMVRLHTLEYLHPLEYMVAQNEVAALDQERCGTYNCCILLALNKLMNSSHQGPERVIKTDGNAMNLLSLGEFMLYTLASTEILVENNS